MISAGIVDLVLPAACAGCRTLGSACCAACLAEFGRPQPVARGPTPPGVPVYALARYRGTARRLVLAYKERGRRDLGAALGGALAQALPHLPGARAGPPGDAFWLVPVPSRPSAARVRGGPHVLRLARSCAENLATQGFPAAVAPALELGRGVRDAVGLGAAARAANLAGRVRIDPAGLPPPGVPVVLLDDVITTGTTVRAAIDVLHGAGVPVGAVLALLSR